MTKTIGIIGGGQLGYMMVEFGFKKCGKQDITILILNKSLDCSCSQLLKSHSNVSIIIGDINNPIDVKQFAEKCDVVTWEIEHFDTMEIDETLAQKFVPDINIVRMIQNKISQKRFYTKHDIPTAAYSASNCDSNLLNDLKDGKGLVIKYATGGLDGRAVRIVYKESDMNDFIQGKEKDKLLFEEKISVATDDYGTNPEHEGFEIGVIVAQQNDNIVAFDPTGMVFDYDSHILNTCRPLNHLCAGPQSDSLSTQIERQAIVTAINVVKSFSELQTNCKSGLFAVEMFYDASTKRILVNEVAPRVHNSGHHTIHSDDISQFEMLARIILNISIATPKKMHDYIMHNILGPHNLDSECVIYNPLIFEESLYVSHQTFLVNYHKSTTKFNRKLAHLTHIGPISQTNNGLWKTYSKYKDSIKVVPTSSFSTPRVGVIMGSNSDLNVMEEAISTLKTLQIPYETTVVSAHRTPDRLYKYAKTAKERGLKVIIAGAGGAAHLPGMIASLTSLPVIGVPVKSSNLSGVDSLYSIVQMPPGVPVASMAINGAKNAAIFAAQILSVSLTDDESKLFETNLTKLRQNIHNDVIKNAVI